MITGTKYPFEQYHFMSIVNDDKKESKASSPDRSGVYSPGPICVQ